MALILVTDLWHLLILIYLYLYRFPGYIFQALSYFNWISWIAPTNVKLAIITGSVCGMGLNPWPTFDVSHHHHTHAF